MDISEQYVKMCKKATEIQMRASDRDDHHNYWREHFVYRPYTVDIIWLPRQDQLQEMLGDFEACIDLIDRWDAVDSLSYTYVQQLKLHSMEQLWLCLVMKERFGKVWNGEDWEVLF